MKLFMGNTDSGTVARTICLMLALVNQIFAILGASAISVEDDVIYQLCSVSATVITAVAAWWKNNNFTEKAKAAQQYKEKLKQ